MRPEKTLHLCGHVRYSNACDEVDS
jgi:hypothetical protein